MSMDQIEPVAAQKQQEHWEFVKRTGPVIIERRQNGRLYMKVFDASRRGYIKKSCRTEIIDHAMRQARAWKQALENDKAEALRPKSERLGLDEALREGIRLGGKKNHTRQKDHGENLDDSRRYFMDWARSKGLRYWDQINKRVVDKYIDFQKARGLKPKTLRNYVSVLSICAAYWFGVDNRVHRPLLISHPALDLGIPEKHFLTLPELFKAIETAKKQKNRYGWIGLVLGGLGGLRIEEMIDIRREHFDPNTGILNIVHAKTPHSPRLIPVLPFVSQALKYIFDSDDSLWLIHKRNGDQGTDGTLAKPMARAIRGAGLRIAPKDAARKTFMNWSLQPGMIQEVLDLYSGHAPKSTAAKFYREKPTPEKYREFVLDPIQKYLDGLSPDGTPRQARILDVPPGGKTDASSDKSSDSAAPAPESNRVEGSA